MYNSLCYAWIWLQKNMWSRKHNLVACYFNNSGMIDIIEVNSLTWQWKWLKIRESDTILCAGIYFHYPIRSCLFMLCKLHRIMHVLIICIVNVMHILQTYDVTDKPCFMVDLQIIFFDPLLNSSSYFLKQL